MTMNYTDFNPTLYFLCSDSDETTKLEVEVPLMPTVQKVKKLCHNDPVAMAEFFQFMNRNFIRSFMGWLEQEGKGRQVRNVGGVYGLTVAFFATIEEVLFLQLKGSIAMLIFHCVVATGDLFLMFF